jgi:hypothetical protein
VATSGELAILYPGGSTGADVYIPNTVHDPSPPVGAADTRNLSCRKGFLDCNYFPRRVPVLPSSPQDVRVGDTFEVQICWGNLGTAVNSSRTFDIALSLNSTLDAVDHRVGNNTWSVPSVSAYTSACQVFTVTVPNTVVTGLWNVVYGLGGTTGNDVGVVNLPLNVIR